MTYCWELIGGDLGSEGQRIALESPICGSLIQGNNPNPAVQAVPYRSATAYSAIIFSDCINPKLFIVSLTADAKRNAKADQFSPFLLLPLLYLPWDSLSQHSRRHAAAVHSSSVQFRSLFCTDNFISISSCAFCADSEGRVTTVLVSAAVFRPFNYGCYERITAGGRPSARHDMTLATGVPTPSCCTRKQPGAGLVRFCHKSRLGDSGKA